MVAVDATKSTVSKGGSHPAAPLGPDSSRVVWLARLGALFLVFEIYIFVRWILSSDFVATPGGSDHDPNLHWIRIWEAVSIVGSLVFLAWLLRRTMRDRQLPTLGIIAFAWMLTAWQDPGVDAIRPVFSYDSNFFNRGTWGRFIPGWLTASGSNPQPIWFWLATYLLFVPVAILLSDFILNRIRAIFPRINVAGRVAAGIVLLSLLDIGGEQMWLHQGLYQYMRVNQTLSLWPGSGIQMPLYEVVCWGGGMMGLGALMYHFRDPRGRMWTDAGIDRVQVSKGRTATRILALGAVFNIAMLVFNLGFNYANVHANTTPTRIPSYFSNGFCGVAHDPACPPA